MQIEPHLTSYVAIVTGSIGAITGIAGLIMGYISYRRSDEIKKSDRRLNLHKLRNEALIASADLYGLLSRALESRKLVLSAHGRLDSGAMEGYREQHTKDLKRFEELSRQIPPEDIDYDSMSLQQLEHELVRLDRTKGWIDDLTRAYRQSIELDNNLVRELRADTRSGF